jgi:CheY-like chemotaxis protein
MVRRIRALEAEHGGLTPSIALTAYAAAADIKNAKDAGFQAHITKPIDMHKLMEAVTAWGLTAQISS